MSIPSCFATLRIRSEGPISIGTISLRLAALTAPFSETSSQGWATAVFTANCCCAAATSRSNFSWRLLLRRAALGMSGPCRRRGRRCIIEDRVYARKSTLGFVGQRALGFDDAAQCFQRCSPLAFAVRKKLRNCADGALFVHPDQHGLLAQHLLELCHGELILRRACRSQHLELRKSAFIDTGVRAQDINEGAHRGFHRLADFKTPLKIRKHPRLMRFPDKVSFDAAAAC